MAFAMPFDPREMVDVPSEGRPLPAADSIYPSAAEWAGTWAGQQTYAMHAVFPDGTEGLVPCSSLAWEEQTGELAARISASFPDQNLEDGRPLSDLIVLGTPLTILAALQPHLELEEVARGIVEEIEPSDGHGGTFSVIAYDPIHAMLTSEVDWAFSGGDSVATSVRALCQEWSIPVGALDDQLEQAAIPSDGLVFHAETIADILLALLDQVPMPEGEFSSGRWVWRTTLGVLEAVQVGKTHTVYWIKERESALSTSARVDMSSVVSKIVVTGQAELGELGESPNRVIGTFDALDQTRGVRQAILHISQNMTVADVEQKAREMFSQKGVPRLDRSVDAPDIPMLRKYDQVRVSAGTIDGYFAIEGVSHDQDKAAMSLKLGNLQLQPLMGTFTLIDADAIPPPSQTSGDGGTFSMSDGGTGGSGVPGGSGPFSPAQVCSFAKAAGFPDPALATSVSMAENRSGDPRAFSSTQDIGLWQVNVPIWGSQFGGQSALTDPMTNAKAAKTILDKQGWSAWTTYRQGLHRQFLGEAQSACAQNVSAPSAPASSSGGGLSLTALGNAIRPWLGTPYLMGGTSKAGIDCSSFVQQVYRQVGVSLPRIAQQQYDATKRVNLGQEKAGDLVFFSGTYNSGTPVSHVGIVTDPRSKQMAHCGDP